MNSDSGVQTIVNKGKCVVLSIVHCYLLGIFVIRLMTRFLLIDFFLGRTENNFSFSSFFPSSSESSEVTSCNQDFYKVWLMIMNSYRTLVEDRYQLPSGLDLS